MTLRQRVPLGKTERGDKVFITVEWLNDLKELEAGFGTPADITALLARVLVLETNLAALTARVRKLEGGYQA